MQRLIRSGMQDSARAQRPTPRDATKEVPGVIRLLQELGQSALFTPYQRAR